MILIAEFNCIYIYIYLYGTLMAITRLWVSKLIQNVIWCMTNQIFYMLVSKHQFLFLSKAKFSHSLYWTPYADGCFIRSGQMISIVKIQWLDINTEKRRACKHISLELKTKQWHMKKLCICKHLTTVIDVNCVWQINPTTLTHSIVISFWWWSMLTVLDCINSG